MTALSDSEARPAGSGGAAWPLDLDVAEFLAGLGGAPCGSADEQDVLLAAELDALEVAEAAGREPAEIPGRVAEALPAGPGLAAWLSGIDLARAGSAELPAIVTACRRLTSWAQARELQAAATIASRCAADNPRVGADAAGRPAQLLPEAAAQVAFALGMSQPGALDWTGLAVQLGWQLSDTGAALSDARIDLPRARLIAEATSSLSDKVARTVESQVLPAAGQQTTGQLRTSLRRAVIAADPEGAEQRRKDSERIARVRLYPDENGTATLAGSSLPGVQAAAAMARISAMARALKAAGAGGGLDLLRANILLGLLLGTLPLIPPAPGAPPDDPPPDDGRSDDVPPGDAPSGGGPADDVPPDDAPSGGGRSDDVPPDDAPSADAPAGPPGDSCPACDSPLESPVPDGASADRGWSAEVPPPGDQDAPEPEPADDADHGPCAWCEDDDDESAACPAPAWPELPAELPALPPSASRPPPPGRPPLGLLDVILPWPVLAGGRSDAAELGRIGPITRVQARQLAVLGAASGATRWRIILTDENGRALAIEPFRPPGASRAGSANTTAVVGRVTVTIRARDVAALSDHGSRAPRAGPGALPAGPGALPAGPGALPAGPGALPAGPGALPAGPGTQLGGPGALLGTAARAAVRAAAALEAARAADAQAGGRCAHTRSTAAYRPSPRLREFVAARDGTCRSPTCGQPAWRGDLDHTVPWQDGGLTCSCNLGGVCRTHHKIKQLPGWRLEQLAPGHFRWTTPAGRQYDVRPDSYPV